MKRRAVALALALVVVAGCSRHDTPAAPAPAALPPVPARLLLTGTLARPDGAWTDVQKQLGTIGAFLPATFAGVVGSVWSLDRELTALVDGEAPLYFAVQAGEVTLGGPGLAMAPPRWALALPVKDVARVRGLLGALSDAGAEGVEIHAPDADAGHPSPTDEPVLGRVTAAARYLIVASDGAGATELAPYVTRVLAAAPATSTARPDDARALLVDVPHAALAGPVAALLSSRWAATRADLAEQASAARERHGGRAADFADPDAVLKVADGVVAEANALLADLDHASIRIALGEENVSAQITLTPLAGGPVAAPWVRSLAACDPAPLAKASLDAPAVALVCSHGDDRAAFAATLGSEVRAALGARLPAAQGDRLQKALGDLARVRGDWLSFALALGGGARLDLALGGAGTPEAGRAAREAIRSLVDLAHEPGFAEPLAADLGLRVRPAQEASAALERLGSAKASASAVTWRTDTDPTGGARLTVAAGPDASTLLGPPTRAVSDDPALASLLAAAALARPTFALLVQPQMAGSLVADARPHAAVALAFGATASSSPDAYVRVVADPALARSILRLAAGF